MERKKKVIIDCDPGIDDSLALLLALKSEELEVIGITIVCGNVPIKEGGENALKTLEILKALHIPIYLGEEKPLKRQLVTAQDTHGEDGLGQCFFEKVEGGKVKEGAVDFIIDTLKKEKVSIIVLGPLTNIAKAIAKDKKAFENLEEFVSMGGAFRIHGNCSPVAEFNYWVDPHGADYVFQNLAHKVHLIPLDITRKIVLTPNILEGIRRLDNSIGEYIIKVTKFYVDFHWRQEGIIGCVINDPLAVAYFIDKSLCSGFSSYVEVVKEGIAIGQTIVDRENFWGKPHNALVMDKVDSKKFMYKFLETIFKESDVITRILKEVI